MFLSYLSQTVRGSNVLPSREVGLVFEAPYFLFFLLQKAPFCYQFVAKLDFLNYKTTFP